MMWSQKTLEDDLLCILWIQYRVWGVGSFVLHVGKLSVSLLGNPRLSFEGTDITAPSRKSLALLCLLSCQAAPMSRKEAANLLWEGGLGNVRQALYQLKQLPGADEWLDSDTDLTVAAHTDVAELEALIAEGDFEAAIGLWRGPFMDGLTLADCPDVQLRFDEEERRVEALLSVALTSQASELMKAGNLAGALTAVEQQLRLDPFDEASLQRAMRLEFMLDRPEAALVRYGEWAQALAAELNTEPGRETNSLADAIREGHLPPGSGFDAIPVRLRQLLGAVHLSRGELGIEELAEVLRREAFEVSEGIATLRHMGLVDGLSLTDRNGEFRISCSDSELLERRIAEVLESGEVEGWQAEAALGGHWLRAGIGRRAAPWLLRAARGALGANSLPEALELCFRASWTGDQQERFDALMILETLCERTGDDSLRLAALNEAADLAWLLQDDRALCRVELARARLYTRGKDTELALSHADDALAIARRSGENELEALAWNGMGAIRFSMGDLSGALEAFTECVALDVNSESMRALANMGAIHGLREQHDTAYELFESALTLARRAGDLLIVSACLNNLAASAERLGAYPQSLKHLHESRQIARRLQHRALEAQVIHNLSVIYTNQGSFGPAWNTTLEVIEESDATGDSMLRSQGMLQAAEVARRCADGRRHRELLAEAGELVEKIGDQRRLVAYRSVVAVQEGPHTEIPEHVTAVKNLGLKSMYSWLLLELALRATDRSAGEAFLAAGSWQGPHQAFAATAAQLRLILSDYRPSDLTVIKDLVAELALEVGSVEYAEVPFVCHLLALAESLAGEDGSDWLRQRDEILTEQGRGLPRDLKAALLSAPEAWLESVEYSQQG